MRALPWVLGCLVAAAGCSNNRAACEADCNSRVERCDLNNVDCAALCGTYVDLGDPYNCADERLVYQGCVVDSACTTECTSELGTLNDCVAAASGNACLAHCRERTAAGCGDAGCDDVCIGIEYAGRATGCRAEVDRWEACVAAAPTCDVFACVTELADANDCRTAYCAANPTAPACM